MSSMIHNLIEDVRQAFCTLHHIQFDAPWDPIRGGCR